MPIIHYMSDIHLEFRRRFPILNKYGKYLALCGDIGNPLTNRYKRFIRQCSRQFEHIILITGNHEYWSNRYVEMKTIDNYLSNLGHKNVYYLNRNIKDFKNFTVIGTTLWSNVRRPSDGSIGDERYITRNGKKVNYRNVRNIHLSNKKWLEQTLRDVRKPAIVITHHLPSFKLIIPKYHTKRFIKVHDRFASNLDYLIQPPVKAWLCGHSHCRYTTKINNVYVGINAQNRRKVLDTVKYRF